MSIGKFVTGFIIGGFVGAISGLLLAPQSGEETREILEKNAKSACKKTQDKVREIQDKADSAISSMQKKGEEIVNKIQGMIDENS